MPWLHMDVLIKMKTKLHNKSISGNYSYLRVCVGDYKIYQMILFCSWTIFQD